ncbi:hypothetical protein MGSAQ_000712 [marine sediment metagenome]|uniref:Uncharacterized protein n=1 Tax=marine sediment metagenome TaxID=412755 RepID=A0A1B6NXP1_9ZZZZ
MAVIKVAPTLIIIIRSRLRVISNGDVGLNFISVLN